MSLNIHNEINSMRLFMKHKRNKNLNNNQISNNKNQALTGNRNNKAQAMTGNRNNKAQAMTGNHDNKAQAMTGNRNNKAFSGNTASVMGGLSGTANVNTKANAKLDSHKRITRNKGNKYYQNNTFPPGYVDRSNAINRHLGYRLGRADQKIDDTQKIQKQSDELQNMNSKVTSLEQEVKDLKKQKNPQPEVHHAPQLDYGYTFGGSHHYQIPYNIHPYSQTYHDGYYASAYEAGQALDDGKTAESADDIIAPKIDYMDSPKLYTMSNRRLSKVPSIVDGLYSSNEPSKSDDDDLEK